MFLYLDSISRDKRSLPGKKSRGHSFPLPGYKTKRKIKDHTPTLLHGVTAELSV